jgi:hypothetical protein
MKNSKKLILGSVLSVLSLAPMQAFAQSYDAAEFSEMGRFDVKASVGFTIPLGNSTKRKLTDQARFGVGLDLVRSQTSIRSNWQSQTTYPVLNLGLYESNSPSLQFNRTELIAPIPSAIYAKDAEEGEVTPEKSSNGTTNAALIIAGGLIIGGGLVYLGSRELEDGFEDAFD